jgi:sulfur transfer protein SufE
MFSCLAIKRLGENTRYRGLTNTSWSREEVRVNDLSTLYRISECTSYVLLSADRVESRGAIFSGENEIGHGYFNCRKIGK